MPQRKRNDYLPNRDGKYDCPVPGCTRTGDTGLRSPQGVSMHLTTSHRGWTPRSSASATPPADAAQPYSIRSLKEALPDAAYNVRATEAAIAILKLAELRGLDHDTLEQVFAAVCRLRALDQGGPMLSDTGFRMPRIPGNGGNPQALAAAGPIS